MCYSPIMLPTGVFTACRECLRCKDKVVNDWVGRCTAEARTATKTVCMTLTYGPDEQGNKVYKNTELLVLRDLQLFFKSIRNAGHKVRYFAVGEYGKEKGRAHWHVILFFKSKPPKFPHPDKDGRIWIKHWRHGHINLDTMVNTLKAVRYAAKYLQKEESQIKMTYSTNPALGAEYFASLAIDFAKQGIAPQTLHYTFGDHRRQNGALIRYYMHRGAGDKFIAQFLHAWQELRPDEHVPASEMIEQWLDKDDQIASDAMAMDYYLERLKAAKGDYRKRLEAEREERFKRDKQREEHVKKKKEEQTLRDNTARKFADRGDSGWRSAQARHYSKRGRVNVVTPGYDETKSIYTPNSAGLPALIKRRP